MTMREGMADLIKRLRAMTEAGTADYTLAGETYWSDDHLQAVLDEQRTFYRMLPLQAKPDYLNGTYVYKRYEIPRQAGNAVEGAPNFTILDSTGTVVSGTYTFLDRELAVAFDEDQEGEARYWTGYAFDLQKAAVAVWLQKAGHMHLAINFSADGHKFDRAALFEHCMTMAKRFGYRQGMHSTRLVRTDLAGPGDADRF